MNKFIIVLHHFWMESKKWEVIEKEFDSEDEAYNKACYISYKKQNFIAPKVFSLDSK